MGTEAIQGMAIDLMKVNDMSVDENVFCNLQNLRLLQLNHVKLGGGCEYLLRKLTWLCWHGFPLSSIPDGLYGENLVAIDMRYSNLRQVKNSKNLKDLSLCGCKGSTSTTLASRLRSWFLPPSPTNLLPPSFHGLDRLTTLSLRDCNLSDDALPRDLGSLRSLTNLELGRNSFRSLPASLSNLLRLTGFELHIIGKIARHIISFTVLPRVFGTVAINLVKSCEDHLWQGHLSNKDFKLGSEDEAELIVDCGNTMIVKKTGVYLVFEQDEARLNSKRSLDTDDVAGSSCDNLLQTKRMRFETSQQNIDENMDVCIASVFRFVAFFNPVSVEALVQGDNLYIMPV
ncbi:hypothetical protein OIU78_022603 [Salix suchowensis]|nr:hypothetical protein OIU78_022603 [Salix suchowensis]